MSTAQRVLAVILLCVIFLLPIAVSQSVTNGIGHADRNP